MSNRLSGVLTKIVDHRRLAMGLLRNRDKDEVRDIAYQYAQQMQIPWAQPVVVSRTGLRKWRVRISGEFAGGRSEFVVDDRSGDVDDIKVAC